MRFQKLNENKLKIFLSYDELPNNENLDGFIANSNEARHTFLDILEKAYDEVGFNTRDYKIKIDAVALRNGDFVFTVTKLIKLANNRKVAKPRRIPKVENLDYAIYKFEKLDDFCNFCDYLKKINLTNIKSLAQKVELYLYNDCYYLSITNINQDYDNLPKFYCSITEFCKYFSSKDLFVSVLKEKGTMIIKNNAIQTYLNELF